MSYKVIQGYTRSQVCHRRLYKVTGKSYNVIQGHIRLYKVIQGYTRLYKVTGRSYKVIHTALMLDHY